MLIEFSVENYRSIREKITFSMVASEDIEALPENTFAVPGNEIRLLKSAVIYGPNAAGKSNLVRAMLTLKNIVRNSATGMRGSRDKLPVEPFRLDSEYSKKPTLFELIFICEEVRYELGVSLDQERVYEEWLIAYFDNEQQNLYERNFNPDNQEFKPDYKQYDWYFSDNLSGENEIIKNLVRRNSLFISHAAQNSHPLLEKIYNWFNDQFNICSPGFSIAPYTAVKSKKDDDFREKIAEFLREADLGILDFRVEEKPISNAARGFLEKMITELNLNSEADLDESRDLEKILQLEVITKHQMIDSNQEVEFDIEDESGGTRRLFGMAGAWLTVLEKGEILVIDEMERSLHPMLSRFLVKMFNDPEINKNNAQLIFTTHDTTFLCDDLFRQDQVWFVEKEKMSITRLYSLLEFQPQEDESLQTGYLLGRYGAIPFIGGLSF
jgi:AAA15 family ATPase/GTPase